MTEIRLSIIKNHEDPSQDKRVEIHVADVDAVLDNIKDTPDHQFKALAGELKFLVTTALAKCADTDKIEIGPGGAFHCTADGKTQFTL
jgi:hypothetical protein